MTTCGRGRTRIFEMLVARPHRSNRICTGPGWQIGPLSPWRALRSSAAPRRCVSRPVHREPGRLPGMSRSGARSLRNPPVGGSARGAFGTEWRRTRRRCSRPRSRPPSRSPRAQPGGVGKSAPFGRNGCSTPVARCSRSPGTSSTAPFRTRSEPGPPKQPFPTRASTLNPSSTSLPTGNDTSPPPGPAVAPPAKARTRPEGGRLEG